MLPRSSGRPGLDRAGVRFHLCRLPDDNELIVRVRVQTCGARLAVLRSDSGGESRRSGWRISSTSDRLCTSPTAECSSSPSRLLAASGPGRPRGTETGPSQHAEPTVWPEHSRTHRPCRPRRGPRQSHESSLPRGSRGVSRRSRRRFLHGLGRPERHPTCSAGRCARDHSGWRRPSLGAGASLAAGA